MSFFLTAVAVLLLLALYAGLRLVRPAGLPKPLKILAWAIILYALPGNALFFFLRGAGIQNGWTDILAWSTFIGMGFMVVTVSLLLIRDILWLALGTARGTRKLARKVKGTEPPLSTPMDPDRRRPPGRYPGPLWPLFCHG